MGVVVGDLVQKRLLERLERRNSFLVPIEKTTQGRSGPALESLFT